MEEGREWRELELRFGKMIVLKEGMEIVGWKRPRREVSLEKRERGIELTLLFSKSQTDEIDENGNEVDEMR